MNKKRLYRAIPAAILLLSVGALTTYAETNGTTYRYIDGSSYAYNSQGILTITNEEDSSQCVVIDTNDIYANAAAIEEIRNKLAGLGSGSLSYDNASNTYYIDIDGDNVLNEDIDVLIGAVGTATRDVVLEGYTFSSQEAGVNKQGTMIDVLNHNNVLTAGVYTPSGSESALADGSISLSESGATLSAGSTDLSVGIGESVTLPSGYYSSDVTVGNGVVNKGAVTLNFTKAVQSAILDSGYYNGISVDVKGLYDIGYMEGVQNAETKVVYSTIRIDPGEHGKFTSDDTAEAKIFEGPSYTGFTMDVTPSGAYKLTGWDTSMGDDGIISMTAHWIEDEIVSSTIYSFRSGSYYFGKDYVTSIILNAYNSLTISTSDGKGGTFTNNENQVTNSSRSVTASASYDLYVGDEYWKTISCSDTYTGYGTKTEVTTIWDSGNKLYSYAYGWSASAQTTVTFDEPVRYLTIVAKDVNKSADVVVERYIDE